MLTPIIRYIKVQPLSLVIAAVIWTVCLIPIPETPVSDVRFIDKWVHLAMYGGLTAIIMAEYGRRHTAVGWDRMIVGGLITPIVMGGLIELAQAYLTFGIRSGDWSDFAANACGALLGFLLSLPVVLTLARHNINKCQTNKHTD